MYWRSKWHSARSVGASSVIDKTPTTRARVFLPAWAVSVQSESWSRNSTFHRDLHNGFIIGANLLTLNSSKTEFLLIGLKHQLAKINNTSFNTTHSARNLGFIFDERLTFSDQISALSKSCYSHIRQLRCMRSFLDSKTTSLIATFIVHSRLDYCNSLYYCRILPSGNQCRSLCGGVLGSYCWVGGWSSVFGGRMGRHPTRGWLAKGVLHRNETRL